MDTNGLKSKSLAPHRNSRWAVRNVPKDADGAFRVSGRIDGRNLYQEWKNEQAKD